MSKSLDPYDNGYEKGYEEGYDDGYEDARNESYEVGFDAGVDSVIELKDPDVIMKNGDLFKLKTIIEYENIFQEKFDLWGQEFDEMSETLQELIDDCYVRGWNDRGSIDE